MKQASTLYSADVVARVRANAANDEWTASVRDDLVAAAQPWMDLSDDDLWDLMFGATIRRSWMVWSNGHCPTCGESVPMYNWKMDAMGCPWKTQCPHCDAVFPTNDFAAFYKTGLDEHGVFDPARADRALLFNADHPDPSDPLHTFGVDDGEGYVDKDGNRWRFIGAYLIYGQWKQALVGGIRTLAAAHVMTDDPVYAHKAGIMLDRVADLHPTFDFGQQGILYEGKGAAGYVSTWHDACEETRELVMAYDMIFETIRHDEALVAFLAEKARQYQLANPKDTFARVQDNIETRILRDALANRAKIHTNYPRTEIAVGIIFAVLGWPENEAAFWDIVDPMLVRATAVDGVTGEKGLAGYTCYTIQSLAMFLGEFTKTDPGFLKKAIDRQPRLHQTYRFHIDTRCLQQYYPLSGDTGWFAGAMPEYKGMTFLKPADGSPVCSGWSPLPPSSFSTLWQLYELTGDVAFVQTLYHANDGDLDGLPFDIYCDDPAAVRTGIAAVIEREGTLVRQGCINKEQWHIALLRSGQGPHARVAWLDYDSGGGHGHPDGMNLGLFARGLDLMPDFGYPPVQFGGWGAPKARSYVATAAHNTVVVDRNNNGGEPGHTQLWADGRQCKAIRASGPGLNGGNRYERTVLTVDVSDEDVYLVDVFRVAGGSQHTKFMHSHFGTVDAEGLDLTPADEFGAGAITRNTRMDAAPESGWSVDWTIDDRHGLLSDGEEVHLRYTDLTTGASAGLTEGWVVEGVYNSTTETWVPRVLIQRAAAEGQPLASTFVAVVEPYGTARVVQSIRRVNVLAPDGSVLPDSHVGLVITLTDGREDLILIRDHQDAATAEALLGDAPLQTDAELALVRLDGAGSAAYAALANGSNLTCGKTQVATGEPHAFADAVFHGPR
ncbi:MAG: hypothetical protein GY851_29470 [bacterium]|nr:hypothetical protein [bacterium]